MNNNNLNASSPDQQKTTSVQGNGVSGGVYGIAFFGAAIYYIQHATTFWEGLLGFLKALFWPAFLVYLLLEFLNM